METNIDRIFSLSNHFMETEKFKKLINYFLIEKGATLNRTFYYIFRQDLIIVIGLQKSHFARRYYINVGYVIKEIHPLEKLPRDVEGDVRVRFTMRKGQIDYFDLDELTDYDEPLIRTCTEENFKQYIEPVTSLDTLKDFLSEHPTAIYQTKFEARELLGIDS